MMTISRYLYALGIILFPFYIFPSGTPQPAHIILLTASIFALIFSTRSKMVFSYSLVKPLLYFVLYVCIINLLAAISYGAFEKSIVSSKMLVPPILEPMLFASFYVFNFIIFIGAMALLNEPRDNIGFRFWKTIFYAILISLVLQAFIAYGGYGDAYGASSRKILFFNNPNQLGYFSILASTLLFISILGNNKISFLLIIGFCITLYLAAISLSKAAFIGISFFPLLYLLQSKGLSPKRLIAVILGAVIVFGATLYLPDTVVLNIEKRLTGIGQQDDDSLAARGYNRILDYPEYLALGAGEGLREQRFGSRAEIHSLFGTVIFSYGVIGAVLVIIFITKLYTAIGLKTIMVLVPVLLYNLTHNGIRNPLLWIAIAMLVSLTTLKKPIRTVKNKASLRNNINE